MDIRAAIDCVRSALLHLRTLLLKHEASTAPADVSLSWEHSVIMCHVK